MPKNTNNPIQTQKQEETVDQYANSSPDRKMTSNSANSRASTKPLKSKKIGNTRNIIILLVVLLMASIASTGYLLISNSTDTETDQEETSNSEDTINTDNTSRQNSEANEGNEQNETERQTAEEDSNDNKTNNPPAQQDNEDQTNPYKGWMTYTNQLYGYSIKYPDNWSVNVAEPKTCPEMVTGCREVENKGDFVEITRALNVGFIIRVDNYVETDMTYGCSTLSVGDPISIDGKTFKTLYNSDSFNMIVKNYDTREIGGETAVCPYSFWDEKGNTYFIGSYDNTQPSPSDTTTVIKMLESLDF